MLHIKNAECPLSSRISLAVVAPSCLLQLIVAITVRKPTPGLTVGYSCLAVCSSFLRAALNRVRHAFFTLDHTLSKKAGSRRRAIFK